MATSYAATFSSACKPAAPCLFDINATQKTGALSTGIGLPTISMPDGTQFLDTYIGGAVQTVQVESSGDPNSP